jgi:hypothetical protein
VEAIPEKPHKTQENREIHVDRAVVPVEICSAHENSLECVWKVEIALAISGALT